MAMYMSSTNYILLGVGNELVHAGSHTRLLMAYREMPSQGDSTEWWYLHLIKSHEPLFASITFLNGISPAANHVCYVYSDCINPTSTTTFFRSTNKILGVLRTWSPQSRVTGQSADRTYPAEINCLLLNPKTNKHNPVDMIIICPAHASWGRTYNVSNKSDKCS